MKKVLMILADGFEEIEALGTADILRRAKLELSIAGLNEGLITSVQGIKITPDCKLSDIEIDQFDAVVLPGGQPGANNLNADKRVIEILHKFNDEKKLICAICAAPFILAEQGILKGRKATCFPAYKDVLNESYVEQKVVVDGNIIPSRGPATAPDFAFTIVDKLVDTRVSETLKKAMLYI